MYIWPIRLQFWPECVLTPLHLGANCALFGSRPATINSLLRLPSSVSSMNSSSCTRSSMSYPVSSRTCSSKHQRNGGSYGVLRKAALNVLSQTLVRCCTHAWVNAATLVLHCKSKPVAAVLMLLRSVPILTELLCCHPCLHQSCTTHIAL